MLNTATTNESAAERATTDATTLTPGNVVRRFTGCAEILRATPASKETVISYPVVGTTTLAVVAEVALVEATVHLVDLDYADAASNRHNKRSRRRVIAHRGPRPDRSD